MLTEMHSNLLGVNIYKQNHPLLSRAAMNSTSLSLGQSHIEK